MGATVRAAAPVVAAARRRAAACGVRVRLDCRRHDHPPVGPRRGAARAGAAGSAGGLARRPHHPHRPSRADPCRSGGHGRAAAAGPSGHGGVAHRPSDRSVARAGARGHRPRRGGDRAGAGTRPPRDGPSPSTGPPRRAPAQGRHGRAWPVVRYGSGRRASSAVRVGGQGRRRAHRGGPPSRGETRRPPVVSLGDLRRHDPHWRQGARRQGRPRGGPRSGPCGGVVVRGVRGTELAGPNPRVPPRPAAYSAGLPAPERVAVRAGVGRAGASAARSGRAWSGSCRGPFDPAAPSDSGPRAREWGEAVGVARMSALDGRSGCTRPMPATTFT